MRSNQRSSLHKPKPRQLLQNGTFISIHTVWVCYWWKVQRNNHATPRSLASLNLDGRQRHKRSAFNSLRRWLTVQIFPLPSSECSTRISASKTSQLTVLSSSEIEVQSRRSLQETSDTVVQLHCSSRNEDDLTRLSPAGRSVEPTLRTDRQTDRPAHERRQSPSNVSLLGL